MCRSSHIGYNSTNSPGAIAVDLETAPMDGAAQYVPEMEPVPPLDLDSIQAAKNLKDPDKIAWDIAKRRSDAIVAHEERVQRSSAAYAEKLGKAALDFNLARIVAISWSDGRVSETLVCECETDEQWALNQFWNATTNATLVGFRIRTFDAPMLMARSRYLGVKYPTLDLGRYGRSGRVVDLWDVLTFGLSDYETTSVMPRGLKSYAKRYGLEVEDEIDGKDIPALVQAGDWDAVRAHIESDVRLTVQLAQRLGVMRKVEVAA
jgi:DNA polymerase elongation subunit (family B)